MSFLKKAFLRLRYKMRRLKRLLMNLFGDQYGRFKAVHCEDGKRRILHGWNSEEGRRRLISSQYRDAFFRLAHCYQSQINPFFCGVACTAMALNVLQLGKKKIPVQEMFSYDDEQGFCAEYRLHTQLTILNEHTEKIKPKKDIVPTLREEDERNNRIFNPGLDLHEVKALLEYYGANVSICYAEASQDKGLKDFAETVKKVMRCDKSILIVNFHGQQLGAGTKGHFSAIAAYDENSESLLVLDAAAHKNPWFWAPIKPFYTSMQKGADNKTRGYLVVS